MLSFAFRFPVEEDLHGNRFAWTNGTETLRLAQTPPSLAADEMFSGDPRMDSASVVKQHFQRNAADGEGRAMRHPDFQAVAEVECGNNRFRQSNKAPCRIRCIFGDGPGNNPIHPDFRIIVFRDHAEDMQPGVLNLMQIGQRQTVLDRGK